MSWLYRHFPPIFFTNWYKVDIVENDGTITKTESACRECGKILMLLNTLTPEEVEQVFNSMEESDEKNL